MSDKGAGHEVMSSAMLDSMHNHSQSVEHNHTAHASGIGSPGHWDTKIIESSVDSHATRLVSGTVDLDLGCDGVNEALGFIKHDPAMTKNMADVANAAGAFKFCDLTDPSLAHIQVSGNLGASSGFTPSVGKISATRNTGDEMSH